MIGGTRNMFVSVQCSESQSDGKFKQTRAKGGSIYDSLKVTSNGNLKQAWVNGGRGHDSVKIASALNFQSDGNTRVAPAELWLRDDLEDVSALLFRFFGFGFQLAMSNVGWHVTQEAKRLLETGELFPRGTAEEPHAPDAEADASDSEPEAHVMEPLAQQRQ